MVDTRCDERVRDLHEDGARPTQHNEPFAIDALRQGHGREIEHLLSAYTRSRRSLLVLDGPLPVAHPAWHDAEERMSQWYLNVQPAAIQRR